MKLTISNERGDVEIVCEGAKVKDGFLQITAPEGHKEVLISLVGIKMIVVD